jgi:hypothetical protein
MQFGRNRRSLTHAKAFEAERSAIYCALPCMVFQLDAQVYQLALVISLTMEQSLYPLDQSGHGISVAHRLIAAS